MFGHVKRVDHSNSTYVITCLASSCHCASILAANQIPNMIFIFLEVPAPGSNMFAILSSVSQALLVELRQVTRVLSPVSLFPDIRYSANGSLVWN
jgi:hypothetical protein